MILLSRSIGSTSSRIIASRGAVVACNHSRSIQSKTFRLPGLQKPANIAIHAPKSLRFFSKQSSSPSNLHAQVSQTLSAPKPPTAEAVMDPNAPRGVAQQIFRHPDRRARYNQALWNAGAAFMLMLMAAQSLKSGRERRRVATELAAVEQQSAQRLELLQSLFDQATIHRMVDDILEVLHEHEKNNHAQSSSSWFGKKQQPQHAPNNNNNNNSDWQRQQVAICLLQNLDHLVGATALDEAQRTALQLRLQQVQQQQHQKPSTSMAAQVTTPAPTAVPAGPSPSSSEPPKRVPFTM